MRLALVCALLVLASMCTRPEETPVPVECEKDCNDFNPCTMDFCDESGECKNFPLDGRVQGCQEDTGACSMEICVRGTCQNAGVKDCCGNGVCENGEDFSNCKVDCVTPIVTERSYVIQEQSVGGNDTVKILYNNTRLKASFKSQYNESLLLSSSMKIDLCDRYDTRTGYLMASEGSKYWMANITLSPQEEKTIFLDCAYYVEKTGEGNTTQKRSLVVFPKQEIMLYTQDGEPAAKLELKEFILPPVIR